ncbi:hypothetical protein VTK56DRAFT_5274 [Thermocarpiscus australiensis]
MDTQAQTLRERLAEEKEGWTARPTISGPIGPVMLNGRPIAHHPEVRLAPNGLAYNVDIPFSPVVTKLAKRNNDENLKPIAQVVRDQQLQRAAYEDSQPKYIIQIQAPSGLAYTYGLPGSPRLISIGNQTIVNEFRDMPAEVTTTEESQRGIPKSQTFSVLSSLKQSFSGGSLTSWNNARLVSSESSGSSVVSRFHAVFRLTRKSTPVKDGDSEQSSPSPRPDSPKLFTHDDFRLVQNEMPSAWWTGRFVSTYDRLFCELLPPEEPPLSSVKGNTGNQPGTASRRLRPYYRNGVRVVEDDDSRARRVIDHLHSLCVTQEARASFRAWQISYARSTKRPGLLPMGATMHVDDVFAERSLPRGKRLVRKLRRSFGVAEKKI